MRTNYSAPGVYVEEVPSARQPIAGVGTNTVGFIGVVPPKIEVPVRNELYDPELAAKPEKAPAVDQDAIKVLEKKGADLAAEDRKAKEELAQAEKELAAADDTNRVKLQNKRDKAALKSEGINQRLEAQKKELADASKPPQVIEKNPAALTPYNLETVTLSAAAGDAKLCTNFTEYTDRFGTFSADDPKYLGHRALTHAVFGFFLNGGTRCFVVRVESELKSEIVKALREFESIDEIALVAAPGLTNKDTTGLLVAHCDQMEDRFAILDIQETVEDKEEYLDLTQLDFNTVPNVLPDRAKNAAAYFPWIEVIDPAKQLQDQDPKRDVPAKRRGKIYVAPSGHIAGVYARVDEQRGVHKAPANEALLGALDLKYYIGKHKQELLNPRGVNCIRTLNGNITVYGARTLGGDKNGEWKYVNVRRVLLFLKESIDEGTQWVVFEPNDQALWAKIVLNVSAFLTNVWRSGALVGATPAEAFYVKCDAELNPPEVRDLGQVVTEIGVAIVRPAEFVIFRISQWSGPQSS